MTVTATIANFADRIDKECVQKNQTFRERVEQALRIFPDDYNNLYVLKYHIEKECDKKMDQSLSFVNNLIDLYSQGQLFKLDQIKTLNDLLSKDISDSDKFNRLINQLMRNAGVVRSYHSSVNYADGKIMVGMKDVIPQDDGSFLIHLQSTYELDWFTGVLFEKYSYMFSRERSNEIKQSIEMLRFSKAFEGKTEDYLCVGKSKGDVIRFTIFGKRFKVDNSDGEGVCQYDTHEVNGIECGVWLI